MRRGVFGTGAGRYGQVRPRGQAGLRGRAGRLVVGGIGAALVAATGVVVPAGLAHAAACDVENLSARGDIDSDGSSDVAVGMPWYGDGSGAVDVRGTSSPSFLLRSGLLGAGTGEGDGFGAQTAIGDLDGDGCADLVVSAPAEGQSENSDGEGVNEGQVHIVFGSPEGVSTEGSFMLPHDNENLDHFGESLVLQSRWDGTSTVHDLYIGAPDATVNGKANAGEVFRYTLRADPQERVVATLQEVRSQDSPGVPGAAEKGDRFGAELASSWGGVLVGVPDEDIGKVRDAGAVWFLRTSDAGKALTSQTWSQDTAGVPGVPETEDHFGATVSSRGGLGAAGIPDEDGAGSLVDVGSVQTFRFDSAKNTFAPAAAITQDSAGIPGAAEAGDHFGAGLVAGASINCPESVDLAVGAPGEDIGTRADAGAVTLVTPDIEGPSCAARVLRQGNGLAGAAEAGDEVGAVLGLTRGRTDLEEDYADRLLIGVPQEDIGAKRDAGMVQPARGGIYADGTVQESLKYSGGYLLENYYGMRLTIPSD